jgi:anti-anti-sigma factor
MTIKTQIPPANPDVIIISLSGRLDVNYSLSIEDEINKLIQHGHLNLVINLQDVEYLSSSGLRIFIATSRQLKAKNGKLKLVKMPDAVRKVFMVVELLDMFEVFDSNEAALSSFGK